MDPETQRRLEKRVRKLDSTDVNPRTCNVCQAEIELMGSTRAGSRQAAAAKPGRDGTGRCAMHAQHTFH